MGRACDLLEGCGCCSCSWLVSRLALPYAKLGKRQRSRHAAPGFLSCAAAGLRASGWLVSKYKEQARLVIAQHDATACEIFRCSCDNDKNRAVHGGVGLSSCLRLAQLLDRWMSTNSSLRFVLRILFAF